MRVPAAFLAVLFALTPVAGAAELAADAVAPVPDGGAQDATQTRCGITVCATSIAIASPICTKPTQQSAQCTAAGAVGGHGVSRVSLPGNVHYSGTLTCSGDCDSTSTNGGGSISWNAFDADGAGQQSPLNLGTRVRWNPLFRECLTIRVTATADAEATTGTAGVILERVRAPQATHVLTASACT